MSTQVPSLLKSLLALHCSCDVRFMHVARYLVCCALHVGRRKDFVEMLVHHVTTISVILISYISGWNRIGAVIMVRLTRVPYLTSTVALPAVP